MRHHELTSSIKIKKTFVTTWFIIEYFFLSTDSKNFAVALHSEALMAGFLKSDLGPHPHGYGSSHGHHSHPHGLGPSMQMSSLTPFLGHAGLDPVGFQQGMWGKYWQFFFLYY